MLPTWRGSNPQPPDHQSDAHPNEPPRQASLNMISLRLFSCADTVSCCAKSEKHAQNKQIKIHPMYAQSLIRTVAL